MRLFANPHWLVGVAPGRLLVVGPERELEVSVELELDALVRLVRQLGRGTNAESVAQISGAEVGEAGELLDRLEGTGALQPAPAGAEPLRGMQLADALVAALTGGRVARLAWTADELLVLPPDRPQAARWALRAFVGGMESHRRMTAYCQIATLGEATLVGDRPPPGAAARAAALAEGLPQDQLHVVNLAAPSVASAPACGPGAGRAHRLGPAVSCVPMPRREAASPALDMCVARVAHPNLRHPGTGHGHSIGLAAGWKRAELTARAEAAERYAVGDLSEKQLVRARAEELDGTVPPDALFAYNRRQLEGPRAEEAFDPSRSYLWTPTADGRRWLPAGSVFTPFADPEGPRLPPPGYSGAAAHGSMEEAVESALRELIERDALMWTWIQAVSRERIERRSLGGGVDDHVRALESGGWTVELVNLTLETKPVILCVMTRGRQTAVGSACHDDPELAAAKAVVEASTTQWGAAPVLTPVEMEEVMAPLDHVRFHHGPEGSRARAFLTASSEVVDLRDVRGQPGSVRAALGGIGDVLVVDLSSPATRPFNVVRAFVPGLVPLSFGFDSEPLGLGRLGSPRATVDGRLLGQSLDLGSAGPIIPHPYP
ncbi:MAG: YcaO-like family protein [Thermoleophilaceae bacterium]